MTPHNRSLGARVASWVEFKMAAQLFRDEPPSGVFKRFIARTKSNYLSKTEDSTSLTDISSFFREIERSVDVLEDKYKSKSRYKDVQQLVETKGMVCRCLAKIHSKIISRLRSTPNTASPWMGDFTMDVPIEVFSVISKRIISRNNFGHIYKETDACINVNFTDKKKAVFMFDKLNLEGTVCAKDQLLVKYAKPSVSPERCEVIVSVDMPFKLTFYKNKEVLSVHFHYGYWNENDIPQH